jgi:molecular chaperone GrpE
LKKQEDLPQDVNDSEKFASDTAWQEAVNEAAGAASERAEANPAENSGKAAAENAVSGEQAASGEPAATGEKTLSPAEHIAELEAQLAEANNNYLRKAADFENFRKRMNQEKSTAIDYANQTLLLDIASVIDDFERAIKSAETQRESAGGDSEKIASAYNSLYEGISLIEKNLLSQLENKWGLKRFDSSGEAFDPNRHEAIMMEKSAELEEPVVAEDFIKGYLLKDRVIRPAKVKVVMPEK